MFQLWSPLFAVSPTGSPGPVSAAMRSQELIVLHDAHVSAEPQELLYALLSAKYTTSLFLTKEATSEPDRKSDRGTETNQSVLKIKHLVLIQDLPQLEILSMNTLETCK